MTIALSPDVRVVLERSAITATTLSLPEQLDRKLYEACAKVIKAAGGKWNRKAATHLFARDPREQLGLALETGTIVDEKTEREAFYTPTHLATRMAREAIDSGDRVLEPSAGGGALVTAAFQYGAFEVVAVESDPRSCADLRGIPDTEVVEGDFLDRSPNGLGTFDTVLMNPPFAKRQDVTHVLHAWKFLRTPGVLMAVMSAGVRFRQDKLYESFRKQVAQGGGTIEPLPQGTFKESGTCVETVLVRVEKTQ